MGNLCDPGADRSSDVPGQKNLEMMINLCGGSSGRSSMRRSHFSNLRYNSNVFCGCTEQSHQSCIHSDAVCHGRGGSLYRRISDRRNREDLVGCTGQQSFDFVCSTDGLKRREQKRMRRNSMRKVIDVSYLDQSVRYPTDARVCRL